MSTPAPEPDLDLGLGLGVLQQMLAVINETAAAPVYEYRRVPWPQLGRLAEQGWELVAIPPIYSRDDATPLYHIRRQKG